MNPLRLLTLPVWQLGSFVSETWTAMRGEPSHPDVPPMHPSLGAIGEAVLDRTFTLAVNLATGVPDPAQVRASQRATRELSEAIVASGWLEDPAAFHATPPPIEEWTESDDRGRAGARRVDFKHMSFESGYRPPEALPGASDWLAFENNRRAHAYVLEHEGEPERPWVVCVHGFGMGTPAANFAGFNVARIHHDLGLNVLMPCLPLHGPRAEGRMSGSDLLSPSFGNMLHVFAQAVWDIRRLIGWVRERGGEKLGLWGVSLGGYTSALVAGFESDLECVIAGIPPTDFPNVARDNMPWIMTTYQHESQVDWQLVRNMTHIVSPLSFEPRVPRERRFIYAGIADRVVNPDQARALWRHWECPSILWYAGGHVASQWKRDVQTYVENALLDSGLFPQ